MNPGSGSSDFSTSSSSCQATNTHVTSEEEKQFPLWNFVTKVGEKSSKGGGNLAFECNKCNEVKRGSYTRVRAHLLREKGKGINACPKVTPTELAQFKKLEDEAETYRRSLSEKRPPLPSLSTSISSIPPSSSGDYGDANVKKRKSNSINQAFDLQNRNQLDAEIARMFYTGGLPFNLARNPYYVSSYSFASNHNLSGYVPPGYNKLRTTLLVQEKDNVDRLLEPIKGTWREKGVSIVSDGWSDSQRRPLINIMISCEAGPMFIKAVDCSGEVKNSEFIASLLSEVIDDVGHQNVVQIVTDNASNCKAAGELIEGRYPHIYWTPCVVHTLNLAIKNICSPKNIQGNEDVFKECSWMIDVHGDASHIKNYIMNHSMRLAMFNKFSSLKLLSVVDTRFASIVVMLKRMKLLKTSLQAMVISEAWLTYRENHRGQASFVREKLLDETWWDQVDYILSFTKPIYDMIRVCDTDKSTLHLAYDMWESMILKVKEAIYKREHLQEGDYSSFFNVVKNILYSRWGKSTTPLHCLAHSLNPRFYSEEWINEVSGRVAPHMDNEISTQRIQCFRRFFPNQEQRMKVMSEYAIFFMRSGPFADPDAILCRYTMDPSQWWASFGSHAPILQKLAFKLLGQPTSSSCCERNWSTYKFINSCARNNLTPKRAQDLVFIHNNLRLLSRRDKHYYDERTKMWDVGGDEYDNLEDIGCLKMAQLSLDEPELENVVFIDDGDGVIW